MLVSPAEPSQLKRLGRSSSTPENYGADFLVNSPTFGLVGIQRKELSDLVASLHDGRITRELIQMKELDRAVWLLEGRAGFNSEGRALWTRTAYTRAQHFGVIFSLTSQGFTVIESEGIHETFDMLAAFNVWLMKGEHKGIGGRGQMPGNEFGGKAGVRDWQVFFLQGLPGMGRGRAEAVVEFYGGLPFELTGVLTDVPGIGKGTAERIREVLGG